MRLFKKKFKLHKYPYIYQCPDCKKRFKPEPFMELGEKDERALKEEYEVKSELPLFFLCDFCFNQLMKPIGYIGKPSHIIQGDIVPLFIELF